MGNNFFVSNNAFVENNDIWMLTNKTNTLCHFSFPDMKFLAHYELPTERIIEYGYLSIAKIQQFIYVIPFVWEDIYKVDTETGKTICIKVPYLDGDNGKYGKFKIVCSYGDKLLLIGHAVKGLFIVDNNGIRIKTDLYDTLEKMGIYSTTEDIWFSDCHVVIDNVIYVPVFHSGYKGYCLHSARESLSILRG